MSTYCVLEPQVLSALFMPHLPRVTFLIPLWSKWWARPDTVRKLDVAPWVWRGGQWTGPAPFLTHIDPSP